MEAPEPARIQPACSSQNHPSLSCPPVSPRFCCSRRLCFGLSRFPAGTCVVLQSRRRGGRRRNPSLSLCLLRRLSLQGQRAASGRVVHHSGSDELVPPERLHRPGRPPALPFRRPVARERHRWGHTARGGAQLGGQSGNRKPHSSAAAAPRQPDPSRLPSAPAEQLLGLVLVGRPHDPLRRRPNRQQQQCNHRGAQISTCIIAVHAALARGNEPKPVSPHHRLERAVRVPGPLRVGVGVLCGRHEEEGLRGGAALEERAEVTLGRDVVRELRGRGRGAATGQGGGSEARVRSSACASRAGAMVGGAHEKGPRLAAAEAELEDLVLVLPAAVGWGGGQNRR